MMRYILVDKEPVREPSIEKWGQWIERTNRIVAHTGISEGIRVSTAFLGLDHNLGSKGPPLLFETMIFGGEHDQFQTRCSTWEQAETEHSRVATTLLAGKDPS